MFVVAIDQHYDRSEEICYEDGADLGPCLMAEFCINSVETSGFYVMTKCNKCSQRTS
jgi:hypothetical protein